MSAPLVINGWTILLHPLFLEQIAALVRETQRARHKDPSGYRNRNAAKRLAAVLKLAFHAIPQDPTSRTYLQGGSLGAQHKHWLRAKFFQQYRLFFRCDRGSRVIVYGWVNDDATKRAYGSATDAYRVFSAMLAKGNPPDDWNALKAVCDADVAAQGRDLIGRANALLR
jgi:toxin YhaV